MKIQIQKCSGNKQQSSDPNTVQIQVGSSVIKWAVGIIVVLILVGVAIAKAESKLKLTELCEVKICNKISRMSLDPFKHLKDSMGESCYTAVIPKEDAVVGKVLDSSSRWYQGSFNPTKKSVTKIKEVIRCEKQ